MRQDSFSAVLLDIRFLTTGGEHPVWTLLLQAAGIRLCDILYMRRGLGCTSDCLSLGTGFLYKWDGSFGRRSGWGKIACGNVMGMVFTKPGWGLRRTQQPLGRGLCGIMPPSNLTDYLGK